VIATEMYVLRLARQQKRAYENATGQTPDTVTLGSVEDAALTRYENTRDRPFGTPEGDRTTMAGETLMDMTIVVSGVTGCVVSVAG